MLYQTQYFAVLDREYGVVNDIQTTYWRKTPATYLLWEATAEGQAAETGLRP